MLRCHLLERLDVGMMAVVEVSREMRHTMMILRAMVAAALVLAAAVSANRLAAAGEKVEVWKSPTCGCCEMWVEHLRENGFEVVARDVDDLAMVKRMPGVPAHLQSCHTGKIGDYVIEGHVPAAAIERLLEQRPDIAGLAVPGMPAGSPGMPSATLERYQVLTFGDGASEVFATFVGPDEERSWPNPGR